MKYNVKISNIDFWSPHRGNKGGMRIYWSSSIGWGTLDIVKEDGSDGEDSKYIPIKLIGFAECMCSNDDKTFINEVLAEFSNMINVVA